MELYIHYIRVDHHVSSIKRNRTKWPRISFKLTVEITNNTHNQRNNTVRRPGFILPSSQNQTISDDRPNLASKWQPYATVTPIGRRNPDISSPDDFPVNALYLGQKKAAISQRTSIESARTHITKAEIIRAFTISMKKPQTRGTTINARWAAPYCWVTAVMFAIAVAVEPSAIPPNPADITTAS